MFSHADLILPCTRLQALREDSLHKLIKIYFLDNHQKSALFFSEKILQFLRLKIEHHAYMLIVPILYVKILCNFVNFFNGGFP